MVSYNKKVEERVFLDLIFGDDERFEVVDDGEDPDFKIHDKESDKKFGVEVTKMFYSETSARTKNIEGYINTALGNPDQLNKADRNKLKPWDIAVIDKSGNSISEPIKGVLHDSPSCWQEYTCRVIDCIVKKGTKFDNYDGSLEYIDLIIYDAECGFKTLAQDKFPEVFTQKGIGNDLVKYLNDSNFRKIYFLTDLLFSGTTRKAIIELKGTFLK